MAVKLTRQRINHNLNTGPSISLLYIKCALKL